MRDDALRFVAGLAVCGGTAAFVWFFVAGTIRWTAGPMLSGTGGGRPAARSFRLTDLIWLLLQLQMAMAAVSYAFPREMPGRMRATALVLLTVPVVLFWLAGLLIVSRAGIEQPFRRATVFVVLMPGVVTTIVGVPLLALGLVNALSAGLPGQSPHPDAGRLAIQLGLLALVSLGLRTLAQWTVSPARR